MIDYVRLEPGEYLSGIIERVGSLNSLFPTVADRAPSIIISCTGSNKKGLEPGILYRFTFFNPVLMTQWLHTPGMIGDTITVIHTAEARPQWIYSIAELQNT